MNEAAPDPQPTTSADEAARPGFYAMALGSVGIVYGDIGTSPLYAFREAATAAAASGPVTREIVLGVLSMILWALILVVTVKYVLILLRADNNGEGGTLALMALAFRAVGRRAPFVMIPRYHRRRDVPRRQRDHAGDLGALRGRGPEAGVARLGQFRAADRGADPGRAVRRAAARHRQGRGVLRARDGDLVLLRRGRRAAAYCATIRACFSRSIRIMR